jgi:monoamine oxidase/GNAT superfamily N-acetyltransferase
VTSAVEICELTGLGHLAPVLGAWHHDEWGHLYAPEVWDREVAVREFEAMAEPGATDRTWVAFDGPSREAEAVLGSVSLVATDDLQGFEHLTPWLASMFVTPAARGRGVAAALTAALLAGARDAGHEVVYLFTSGQQAFWADRGWSVVTDIATEGHPATVMARTTDPCGARRAARSNWCSDPDHLGAYSHLRLHGTPEHRARLSEEILPDLWFAGEATSVEHPATMHGAWFSGERAASLVLADPARRRVVVVGAGLAGLTAARQLVSAGCEVVVVESKSAVGGRIRTDRSLGVPVPLGGGWLHGDVGHPLRDLVTYVADDWDDVAIHASGHGRLGDEVVEQIDATSDLLHEAFERAEPGESVAQVTARFLEGSGAPELVREAVRAVLVAECEGLYGAPIGDLAANGGWEDYELPGGDHLITSDLGAVAERLSEGLDIRCGRRVSAIVGRDGGWIVDGDLVADAVVVTVPIGVLASEGLRFEPALPDDVRTAIGAIGAGPIAKVFVTFDEAWWPNAPRIRLVGTDTIGTLVEVTAATGRPTLLGFAVGEAAVRVERMSEHELCRMFDRQLRDVGLLPQR